MSGETFREQLSRLKRTLRDIDGAPPGQRPGYMPRTKAARLEELAEIRRAHGLQDGQPIRQRFAAASPKPRDDQPMAPLPVWVLNGRRVMAKVRPEGATALSALTFAGEAPGPSGDDADDEPSF